MKQVTRNLLASLIVLTFFWMALGSMVDDSPAMDEQNHLGRGIAYLNSGDPRLSVEHPPLVNLLAALPTSLLPLDIPLDEPAFSERFPPQTFWYSFAESLFWERGNDVRLMIFLGRLPIVMLTIGLGLLGYRFANHLWGHPAGLIALAGILFDPNIITNGRYITTDLGGTFFILLATFTLYRVFANQSSVFRRPVARIGSLSLAIGFAFGAKLTSILFIPIWILLTLLPPSPPRSTDLPTHRPAGSQIYRLTQLALAGLLSLVVLWGIYGFEWGNFLFISESFQTYNRFQGPMPTFWSGIERITVMSGSGSGRYAFLLGQFSLDGFWYYFPVAFAAKTPLITLFALPLSTFFLLWHAETRLKAGWLLIPAVGYFLLAMNSSLNIGYRHLLPTVPFIYILIAGAVTAITEQLTMNSGITGHSSFVARHSSLLIFPLALLATSLTIHPHYISYFNRLFGGPENGYNVLTDSNVDWGQDLQRLEWWMYENGVSEVNLAWYGSADPAALGLNFRPLPGFPRPEFLPLWWDVPFDRENPAPGVYAISAYNYWEMPLAPAEKTVYAWFRAREPDARVGYSILIYVVE